MNQLKQIQKANELSKCLILSRRLSTTPVKNAQHLRQSVVMNRVLRYGIRKVQYLSDHKYISNTELYRQEDLEELTGQLEKYLPLK